MALRSRRPNLAKRIQILASRFLILRTVRRRKTGSGPGAITRLGDNLDLKTQKSVEQLSINAVGTLSMVAVHAANSGDVGTPMALAPVVC